MLKKPFFYFSFNRDSFISFSQTKIDSNFHLYPLLGQSNMAGRGVITPEFQNEGNPQVYMLNKINEWVLAKHPLHFDKPKVAGVVLGLSFGIKMAASNPKIKIGLIPCAVGGSSINVWRSGATPYNDAMKRIAIARQSCVFKGALWHQGESDSTPEGAADYLSKLIKLIGQVRGSTHQDNLPLVVGKLGRYWKQYANINKVLTQVHAYKDWVVGELYNSDIPASFFRTDNC